VGWLIVLAGYADAPGAGRVLLDVFLVLTVLPGAWFTGHGAAAVPTAAAARSGNSGAMRRRVSELTRHPAVAQQQVLTLTQDRTVGVGDPLQPHGGAGVTAGHGPLHEPPRPGKEPL
jgi:hypothetical protein